MLNQGLAFCSCTYFYTTHSASARRWPVSTAQTRNGMHLLYITPITDLASFSDPSLTCPNPMDVHVLVSFSLPKAVAMFLPRSPGAAGGSWGRAYAAPFVLHLQTGLPFQSHRQAVFLRLLHCVLVVRAAPDSCACAVHGLRQVYLGQLVSCPYRHLDRQRTQPRRVSSLTGLVPCLAIRGIAYARVCCLRVHMLSNNSD